MSTGWSRVRFASRARTIMWATSTGLVFTVDMHTLVASPHYAHAAHKHTPCMPPLQSTASPCTLATRLRAHATTADHLTSPTRSPAGLLCRRAAQHLASASNILGWNRPQRSPT